MQTVKVKSNKITSHAQRTIFRTRSLKFSPLPELTNNTVKKKGEIAITKKYVSPTMWIGVIRILYTTSRRKTFQQ